MKYTFLNNRNVMHLWQYRRSITAFEPSELFKATPNTNKISRWKENIHRRVMGQPNVDIWV